VLDDIEPLITAHAEAVAAYYRTTEDLSDEQDKVVDQMAEESGYNILWHNCWKVKDLMERPDDIVRQITHEAIWEMRPAS
jgi:hypothetical protein